MANLRNNGNWIYAQLSTDSTITDLLDTIESYPAIIQSAMVHEAYQDLDLIQIYRLSNIGASELNPTTYTVNCRSSTEVKADAIAQAVYESINRKHADGRMAKCTVYKCIFEDTNHYNTPIDITVYSNE